MSEFVPATDDMIKLVSETAADFVAACEVPLRDEETAFGRNVANMNRLALMGAHMPSVLKRLGQAEQAIAEMRGERGCNCESLLSRESDNISLRASLGRAVEALQGADWIIKKSAGFKAMAITHGNRPSQQDIATGVRYREQIDAVLSDPAGQQAGQEWAARGEVAQKAVAYLESQDKNLMAAIVTVGGGQKKEAKARALEMQACREALQDALRHLKEVQDA